MIKICGDKLVSLSDLQKYAVVRPENAGSRWCGVPHYDVASSLHKALSDRGIGVVDSSWSVDGINNSSLIGGVVLDIPKDYNLPSLSGMAYSMAIRHTNDMKHALRLSVGAQVFICHNGVITGEVVLNRKHTTNMNLFDEIDFAVGQYVNKAICVATEVNKLKNIELDTKVSDHIMMEAVRDGILPWSGLASVDKEYRSPQPQYVDAGLSGSNGWGLYNAFSLIIQKYIPSRQVVGLSRFREIIQNIAA